MLSNLQHPTEVEDAASGVLALRAWGRWFQRCVDCGMNLPDPMVLVSALTSMTKPVLRGEPEVTWRTELVKSMRATPRAPLGRSGQVLSQASVG